MTAEMKRRYCFSHVLPFSIMVACEGFNVGLNTIFKAASNQGLSLYVFLTYSSAIGAIVLLPSLLYRRTALPPLTFSIVGKLFVLSLMGSIALLLCYTGISYSSPTLASAMSNLVPAFTFTLAIIFRMEKLSWRSFSSQAKVLGTAISISGALIIVLYKGRSIISLQSSSTLAIHAFNHSSSSSWVIGGLLLALEYVLIAMFLILQAQVLTEYPAEHVVVFFNSLFSAMISGLAGLVFETNTSAWTLQFNLSLAAILYSLFYSACVTMCLHVLYTECPLGAQHNRAQGLAGSALIGVAYVWVMLRKGPVYVAMFKPLSIAIAAMMGVALLGDTLYLGSIFGAVVISCGFYAVMWGKAKEEMSMDVITEDLESSDEQAPLLQSMKDHN